MVTRAKSVAQQASARPSDRLICDSQQPRLASITHSDWPALRNLLRGEAFYTPQTPTTRPKPGSFKYWDGRREMGHPFSRVPPLQRVQRTQRLIALCPPYLPFKLTLPLAASYRRQPSAHNPHKPRRKPMNQLFLATLEYTRKKPHR